MVYSRYMTAIYIVLGILGVLVLAVIIIYNGLVRARNRKEEAWSDIDVQLKRRYDLIPNLISTVKGYAKHEKETFERVTEMRTKALQASGVHEQGMAENMLTDALKSIFAVAENYPQLQASQNFMELQRELSDTENKIQAARRFYNSTVQELNTALQVFPQNVIASMFSFKEEEFFEIDESEKEAAQKPVEVKF